MKSFKKILAVLCSATLIVSSSVTAFASEETPDPVAPTTGTTGAGNVLSYNFDTVVVPTTIKLTFNPQGLAIAKREDETAVTDQIVSLNYGIASKASQDKKVIVRFAANIATSADDGEEVVFVDSQEKATNSTGAEDTVGAAKGSHKIYLYVTAATAEPKYYKSGVDGGVEFSVTEVENGKNTDDVTAANLSDVVMTAATAGQQSFKTAESNPKNSAYAVLGYKLTAAEYAAMEDLTFDTTAAQVASKMEITELGQITGFTFGGKMNTNTDWTKANLSAIAITPIYELADAGDETAVTGAEGVITLTAADTAEPDKPLTAEEIAAAAAAEAAATAAAGFKTTHAAVLALDEESVTGSEEELAAIDAAIEAFEALSEEVQAILAEDEITADSLAAIKELSEAAGAPTTYALTLNTDNGNLWYQFESNAPTGELTAVVINDTARPGMIDNGNIVYLEDSGRFVIKAAAVTNTALGIAENATTIVATIGETEYTFTY